MSAKSDKPPILRKFYHDYLVEEDSASFILAVSRTYTNATLERLARDAGRIDRRAAVLALGFLGGKTSAMALGQALRDSDRGVRMLAETGIRAVWCRCGSETQFNKLRVVMRLIASGQCEVATERATEILKQEPSYAEAWNQRAIARYYMQMYPDAVKDCHQALELNPYHFGAATGMGECYLAMDSPVEALECFRRALKLNPGLEYVRVQVASLQKTLDE